MGIVIVLEDWVIVGYWVVVYVVYIEWGSLIGIGVIILDNVCIGVGSIIGVGVVVIKDVFFWFLVMGVLVKIIK